MPAHPGGAEGGAGDGGDDGEQGEEAEAAGEEPREDGGDDELEEGAWVRVMAEALVRMSRSNSSVEARSIWLRDMLAMALIMLFSSKDFFDCFV